MNQQTTPIHSLAARYYTDPEVFKVEQSGVLAVCQHRAHQLVQDSGNAPMIVCPYHAWSYELTGQLRGGPNTRSVEGFDRSKICLSEVRIENFCGFLFANLDANAKPMASLNRVPMTFSHRDIV